MFPHPSPVATRPCARCGTKTRVDRLISGYGSECAAILGLLTASPRLRTDAQIGLDLFDNLEEEDHCDGWDR